MNSPTISLCMIVRDAEHTLGAALDSVKPFVDEMIIIDTGSIDKTVQVAEKRGAKIYHFPWVDDFSAARNESIERATGDWIFWMDADDILVQSTGDELRRTIINHPNKDVGFMLHVEEKQPDGKAVSRFLHCKLFPRHKDIRFKYRIHEKVSGSIEKLGYEIKKCNAIVQHANADRNLETNARRIKRNRPLLELELQDHPCDGVVLFNAGYHYLNTSTELAKSVELLERSLKYLSKNNSLRIDAYIMLIKAYSRAKDIEHLLMTCETALLDFPDMTIFLYNLGRVKEIQGDDKAAETHYLRALNYGQITTTTDNIGNLIGQVVLHLGSIYKKTGREHEMESVWLKYLGKYPRDLQVRRTLIENYIRSQRIVEAEKQIHLFPTSPDSTAVSLAMSGCIDVQRKNWESAIKNLTASKKMGLCDPFQLQGLSVAYMAVGRFKEAEPVLKQLLKIVPGNIQATRNLEIVLEKN